MNFHQTVNDIISERDRLRVEVEALKAENAALASWQCLFTDGTTGLYHDGCGNAQCARDHLVVHLTAEAEALRSLVEELAQHDSYSTEYDGRMIVLCPACGEQDGTHTTGCVFVRAKAHIDAARAAQGVKP